MTSDGSPHTRLRRAIQAGNLAIIQVTAAELGYVTLRDALGILLVIESEAEERFDAAAVRWAGRLALETPDLELAELRGRVGVAGRAPGRTRPARPVRVGGARAAARAPLNGEHTRERRVKKPVPAQSRSGTRGRHGFLDPSGAGVLIAGEAGAPHCVNASAFTSCHAEGRSTPRE